jgi:tetratricopeptide (TPR) repeat protein
MSADAAAPRYWAFISYSHRDEAVAKRLQRRLETYRLPRKLVGREGPEGPVPARVRPLFRDRDELHAGADLKAHVQQALAASRWLIVVCSPDAARSPWVEREIVEFKRLHGERRVLALIAAGEPEACFPNALRHALDERGEPRGAALEPIAADLRAHADGPKRAPLKLLAGMVGVGFDELVRRDAARRARWLAAVAAGSLAGMAVLTVLTVLALRARDEARQQRAQAQDLIEFMLTDLRARLEPVGRLDALDAVGVKALAYYAAQDAGQLDATALGHRARAQHLVGEIRELRGNLAEAQQAFEQAAATTERLLAGRPADGRRVFEHAQSIYWVGYVAWLRGEGQAAEARFEDYLALAERLVALDAANPDWRAELAFAHSNLGTVRLGLGRAEAALRSLDAAVEVHRTLRDARPGLATDLSQTHGWRARAYEELGQPERALAEQQAKLALVRSLPDAQKNRQVDQYVVNALGEIGATELALGRVDAARATLAAALPLADALIAADPSNLFWLANACDLWLALARLERAGGDAAAAAAWLQRATPAIRRLAADPSAREGWRVVLDGQRLALAARLGSAAAADLERFLAATPPQPIADASRSRERAAAVAAVALALADRLATADPARAQAAWQRADAELRPLAGTRDGRLLTLHAHARLALGDAAGARALVARIDATAYRHPDVMALRAALARAAR